VQQQGKPIELPNEQPVMAAARGWRGSPIGAANLGAGAALEMRGGGAWDERRRRWKKNGGSAEQESGPRRCREKSETET